MTVDLGDRQSAVHATFPGDGHAMGLGEHDGIVTAWDRSGRIVAADSSGAGNLASLRTMIWPRFASMVTGGAGRFS